MERCHLVLRSYRQDKPDASPAKALYHQECRGRRLEVVELITDILGVVSFADALAPVADFRATLTVPDRLRPPRATALIRLWCRSEAEPVIGYWSHGLHRVGGVPRGHPADPQ